jgi:LPXTG-site transpeptidase (sortase) family protein
MRVSVFWHPFLSNTMNKFKDMFGIYIGFILGVLLVALPLYQNIMGNRPLSSDNPNIYSTVQAGADEQPEITQSGEAVQISIPSVGINLAVINGEYYSSTQSWSLSDSEALFARGTTIPNNKEGNTFIYGHSINEVFGRLPGIKIGDEAQISTSNNLVFTYVFEGSKETSPDDVALFGYKGAPILTLQTCSGMWSQNRSLFVFSLKEVAVK